MIFIPVVRVRYNLGYGEKGQGEIPKYSSLFFTIELLAINGQRDDL